MEVVAVAVVFVAAAAVASVVEAAAVFAAGDASVAAAVSLGKVSFGIDVGTNSLQSLTESSLSMWFDREFLWNDTALPNI